jgi:ankyrin repeat protein
LLLAKDGVDPDSKDIFNQTPLSRAAENRHVAVVRLLLAKGGVDPASKDIFDRTPLSWAAENGHKGVVKLLSAKDAEKFDSLI